MESSRPLGRDPPASGNRSFGTFCTIRCPITGCVEVSAELSGRLHILKGGGPVAATLNAPTLVGTPPMSRGSKGALERHVQDIERRHPDWLARQIERELEALAPVAYGNWRDATPSILARLRQVQRWRRGSPRNRKPLSRDLLFRYIWPVGEKQRHSVDSAFQPRPTQLRATHRLFLRNCGPETLREVRARIDGRDMMYEPSIDGGKFGEIRWFADARLMDLLVGALPNQERLLRLEVDFAIQRGRKRAQLRGELTLHASDGWVRFASLDGGSKELE